VHPAGLQNRAEPTFQQDVQYIIAKQCKNMSGMKYVI